MPEPTRIYIAEVIWFEENPVDGRRRVAVCTSLDGALNALRQDRVASDGHSLTATEVTDSALGSSTSQTWAVHEPDTEPSDFGHLWITSEPLRGDSDDA